MDYHYFNENQIQEIKRYLKIMSKRKGYSLGETGCIEWIDKYAKEYRRMSELIPCNCIGCNNCLDPSKYKVCPDPMNIKRLRLYRSNKRKKENT